MTPPVGAGAARHRAERRPDHGFTLVELLVTIVILATVVGSASAAVVLGLRSTDDAGTRLAESFDAQLVARYFVPDMQSAVSWDDRSSPDRAINTGCQDATSDVLRIVRPATSGPGTAVRYELRTVGATNELVRHRCDFPAGPRSVVLARGMASVVAQTISGVVELVFTSGSGQQWTVSSKPRPGRSLALPVPVVGTGPALVSLQAFDDDGNGFIEKVLATFSASIRCTGGTCSTARWSTQGQGPSGASIGSVTVSGSVATLNLTGHSAVRSTAVASGYRISLSAGVGGIEAASAPFLGSSFGATNVSDLAKPVLAGIDMLDVNTNGKVDRLTASFTEDLAGSTDPTPWTLTGTPSGGTRGGVSTAGPVATVAVNEGAGIADTAVGNLRVTLAASATGIRDAAGNQASFSNATPADKAAPVALTVASANGAIQVGLAEQNDTVTVTFSEDVVGAPASSDVVLSTSNGNNKPVILSVPGVAAAGFAIGETEHYLAKSSDEVTFAGSTVTTAGRTVVVRLAAPSGGTRTQGSYVANTTGSFLPAPGLRDAAGNQAVGSVAITVRFF